MRKLDDWSDRRRHRTIDWLYNVIEGKREITTRSDFDLERRIMLTVDSISNEELHVENPPSLSKVITMLRRLRNVIGCSTSKALSISYLTPIKVSIKIIKY